MQYAHIMSLMQSTQWGLEPDALRAMLSALKSELTSKDYDLFHRLAEDDHAHFYSLLGPGVETLDGCRCAHVSGGRGYLFVNGPIIPRATMFSDISGVASLDQLTTGFKLLQSRGDVKNIVIVADSPGGSITGVVDFASLISGSNKPVTAFIAGLGASAMYLIASAADEIVASPMAIVGSIGVVSTINTRADEDLVEIVSSQSPNKRLDVTTKEGRSEAQKLVDDLADVFIGIVSDNRGVSTKHVESEFGCGGVMVASAAAKVGMVDAVMSFEDFLKLDNAQQQVKQLSGSDSAGGSAAHVINTPADAGKGEAMNLSDLLADNPVALAEYEQALKGAKEAGGSAKDEEYRARAKRLMPFISDDSSYNAAVRQQAVKALVGEIDTETFLCVVSVLDVNSEGKKSKQAQAESAGIKDTKGDAKPVRTDVLDNQSSLAAELKRMKDEMLGEGGVL